MKKIALLWVGMVCAWGSVAWAQEENSQTATVETAVTTEVAESGGSSAQTDFTQSERYRKVWKDRKGYFNFMYGKQDLTFEEGGEESFKLKSDWAAAISFGRTFYLHKRPIAGMIKFGLDWSFLDLNVGSFKMQEDDGYEVYEETLYKGEAGMQFGPSITINPISHLKVAAYFRVVPSYSATYYDDEFKGNYATFFTYGVSVAYKVISLGVEQRWGKTEFDVEDGDYESYQVNVKSKGPRFYLSFRY